MSMHSTLGDQRTFLRPIAHHGEPSWNPISGGKMSDQLVASLATGLRSTYEAQPQADIPDAFAELIAQLQRAENGGR